MDSTSAPSPSTCTRRRILGWGSAGAIGGFATYLGWPRASGVARSTAKAPSAKPQSSPVEPLPLAGVIRREDFVPHLKSQFRLEISGTDCTLVEVSAAQKIVSPTAEFTSFSLLFAAPAGFAAESQVYRLKHAAMGDLDLFLSPVGHSKERVYLEAVFSQRV